MKTPQCALALLALLLLSDAHAAKSSSGTIRFSGAVYAIASASASTASKPDTTGTVLSAKTYALHDAQRMLSCDMLDYFATYAAKDAKVVSVSYN